MLKFLSGKSHEVITSVGFLTSQKFEMITETTKVYFKNLTDQEIDHYIEEASFRQSRSLWHSGLDWGHRDYPY